jgi:hypothetical protein
MEEWKKGGKEEGGKEDGNKGDVRQGSSGSNFSHLTSDISRFSSHV